MSNAKFAVHVRNAWKQVQAKATKTADPIRTQQLGGRTQGYIVDIPVILKEIKRKESPFNAWMETGDITSADLPNIAKQISDDFWAELKSTAKSKTTVYKLENGKVPGTFGAEKGYSSAFDERKRVMYFKTPKGDAQEAFRAAIIAPTIKRIKTRPNPLDPLRVYVSPDTSYEAELNKILNEVRTQADEEGVTTKAKEGRVARAKKAFFSERGIDKNTIWQGIEIGHTFGAKATAAAGFLENSHDVVHNLDNLKLHPYIRDKHPELLTILEDIINHDIAAEWEREYRDDSVAGKVTLLIPESWVNNKVTGGSAGQAAQTLYNQVVQELIDDIINVEGSPSYKKLIANLIEDTFLGRKPKRGKAVAKAKIRDTTKRQIRVNTIPTPKVRTDKRSKTNTSTKEPAKPNLTGLIALINRRMHDKVQENMGKGNSKQILNYQTGRFAKNIKLKDLHSIGHKGAIGATVAYMKHPYQVFEPGGYLYKPGRDPHRIIGRSIRQILQEEKIANLRRVEVRLKNGK